MDKEQQFEALHNAILGLGMSDEQLEALCSAIRNIGSFHSFDAFEHVFGARDAANGVAHNLGRIAAAIEDLANAIREQSE